MEEKKRKEEEEKKRKEEEEERRLRKEENEIKRLIEQEENKRRLEEYENKQKEEEEKRIRRQTLKKQKEEEIRQKREKEAKERRNKVLKKEEPPKIQKQKSESESESESSEEEESEQKQKNIKNDNNEINNNNNKNKLNFHSNPFDLFKSNDDYSDEESSPRVKPKPKQMPSKNVPEPKKKKTYEPKLNDLVKFRESDRLGSDSGSSDYSEEENDIKIKEDAKKELNKSVENRRNNKNLMFNQYTNYFFDEYLKNEEKLRNNKKKTLKEAKTDVERKIKKKGLYHYQNNTNKEVKTYFDKKYENITRNPGIGFHTSNTNMDNLGNFNVSTKKSGNSFKKKSIVKQSSNAKKLKTDNNLKEGKNNEKEMLVKKMQNGRNKNKNIQRQNNTVVYNHKDINLTKSDVEENEKKKVVNHNKNNVLRVKNGNIKKKNSKNKVGKGNNIVTNLIDDFDQTMEEYSSIYTSQNNASRGKNSAKNNNDCIFHNNLNDH